MANLSFFFVVDQLRISNALVGWPAWLSSLSRKNFAVASTILECGYVPAVTPVGHATLSTGTNPSRHGVGGRKWWRRQGNTDEQREIDLLTGTFESTRGLLDVLSFSGAIQVPSGTDPEIEWLLTNSICSAMEKDVFTVVASAKDFVSVLLGGYHADILIYPVIGQPLPGQYTDWLIRIYSNPRRDKNRPFGPFKGLLSDKIATGIVDTIRNFFKQVQVDGKALPDLAKLQSRVADHGWQDAGGYHEFTLPFSREIQRVPENNLLVDKMYSEIVRHIVEEYQIVHRNIAVFQSLYSPDVVAHMTGTRKEYQSVVSSAMNHIRDVLLHHLSIKTVFVDINCCITSDHGGRDTPRKTKLHATPGHPADVYMAPQMPLPIAGGRTAWYQEDGLFCFPDISVHPADDNKVTAIVSTDSGLHYWDLPQDIVDRSFIGVPPRYLMVPVIDQILVRPRGVGFFGDGGSHGLGVYCPHLGPGPVGGSSDQPIANLVTDDAGKAVGEAQWNQMGPVPDSMYINDWQLNPLEQHVPGIFITTKNSLDLRYLVDQARWQSEVREVFVRLARA